ncbi:TPA: histidine kinase, partial [Vibrio vulnificus]
KDPSEKAHFLANHPDSRLLCISAAFVDKIDKVRGNGRDLAMQMVAA